MNSRQVLSWPRGDEATVLVEEVVRTPDVETLTVQHLIDLVAACVRRDVDRATQVHVRMADGMVALAVVSPRPPNAVH